MSSMICKRLIDAPEEISEGLRHQERNVELFCGRNDDSKGSGTLYITEDELIWWSEEAKFGFEMDYPMIMFHSICLDTSTFPSPCIFCHLDTDGRGLDIFVEQQQPNGNVEAGDEDEEVDDIQELRFVPADESVLSTLFDAISECQVLHPDPDEGEEGFADGFLYTAEDLDAHPNQERVNSVLDHLESVLVDPEEEQAQEEEDGRYADGD